MDAAHSVRCVAWPARTRCTERGPDLGAGEHLEKDLATSFVFGKGGHPTQTKKIDTMDVWRVDLTESDDEGGGTPQSSSGDAGNYPGTLRERSLSFHAEVDEITREFLAVGCAPELSVLERCVTKTLPSSPFPPL